MIVDEKHDFLKKKSTPINIFCIKQFMSAAFDVHSRVDFQVEVRFFKGLR